MDGVICLRGLCVALAATAAVDVVLSLPCNTDIFMGVSTERSSSRHPTGAVARVDWIMDVRRRADVNMNNNNN